jgi:DME family drug/metabolite transporter
VSPNTSSQPALPAVTDPGPWPTGPHRRVGLLARRRGLLAVSAGSVLWGTTGVVVRQVHAATGLSAAAIGCYRLAVAALVLAVVRPRRVRRGMRAAWRNRRPLVLSGIGLGGYQALYFLAVQDAGVGVATLVSIGVAPVVTTLGVALARRRRPGAGEVTVLACALAGLILVSLPELRRGPGGAGALGVLAAVGSGAGYGLTVLLNRRLSASVDALTMTVATCAIGGCVLLPLALVAGPVLVADAASWAGLLYVAVVCTAMAYGLFYAGLRSTTGEVAVVLTLLEPLTASVLAVALLHEPLTGSTVIGGMLMLACVVVLYLRPAAGADH